MELKGESIYKVWTGYKIWYSTIAVEREAEKDSDSFEFQFQDLSGASVLSVAAGAIASLACIAF